MIERTVSPMVLRPGMTVLKDGRPHFVSCCEEPELGRFKVGSHDCETEEWDDRYCDEVTIYWPNAGDAVRVTGRYIGTSVGDIGIIGGIVGHYKMDGDITFHYSAFRGAARDNSCEYVSVSGGPCPIGQDLARLMWTGETMDVWFWRTNKYDNSENYQLTVPVWEWNGKR